MGLIKAANTPVSIAAFSMQDIEAQARNILLRARAQAEQLIAAAQHEAENIKKQAHTEGFANGQRDGLTEGNAHGKKSGHAQALAEHQAAMAAVTKALATAAEHIEADRHDLETHATRQVVQLAAAIARRVTKRQGTIDEEVLLTNIRQAMSLVVHAADVRISLHPSQLATLQAELPAIKMAWPQLKHVELMEDAGIAPGGAKISTPHGHIDADLDTQLDRVIGELMPAPAEQR